MHFGERLAVCLVIGCLTIGAVGSIGLTGCSKRANAPPGTTATPYAAVKGQMYVKALEPGDAEAAVAELGLERRVFEYAMPPGSRCTVWVETYRHGTVDEDLCWWESQSSGSATKGRFTFSIFNADGLTDPSPSNINDTGRVRWTVGFGSSSSTTRWIDDPFEGLSYGYALMDANMQNAEYGKTYTIFWMLGFNKGGISGEEAEMISKNPLAVFYKVRFDRDPRTSYVMRGGDGVPQFAD